MNRRPRLNPRAAAPSPSPRVSPIKPKAAAQSPELRCFIAVSIQLLKVVSEPQKPIPNSNCRRGAVGSPAGLPTAPRRQLLLGIGFCGSLTTFSSWMLTAMKHLSSGDWAAALGLIGLTLGLGLGAAALGFSLGRRFKPPAPPQSPT